jgi:hypothetical protein
VTPLVLAALLAAADAPFFQSGSRLGLVPPPGLSARLECLCFATVDMGATIMVNEGPPESFTLADTGGVAELARQGVIDPKREDFTVDGHRAILISGEVRSPRSRRGRSWLLVIDAQPKAVMAIAWVGHDARKQVRAADVHRALLDARLRSVEEAKAPDRQR